MKLTAFAVLIIGLMAFAPHAKAAPQMLGVVASSTPYSFHCDESACKADLTSLCLQAERDVPGRHHGYDPLRSDDFIILAVDGAGTTSEHYLRDARFRSERGYTSTSLTIDAAFFTAQGLTPVAVRVKKAAVLVPHPVADHPAPITEDEIVAVEKRLQPTALAVFKTHRTEVEAITVVSRLLDATPQAGRVPKEKREGLWEDTFGERAKEAVDPGVKKAADVYSYCRYRADQGRFFSVRRCLENRLDGMLMDLNTDYWDAVAPGS